MLFEILGNYFLANIVTFTVIVTLIATLWYYRNVLKPYAKFPSCRLEHRILYWTILRRPINVVLFRKFVELSKKHEAEGMFIAWLFKPFLLAYDEEIVKFIVQDSSTTYRPSMYKRMEFIFGNGLLTSNGDVWKRQKKSITPAFHTKALKTHVSVMNDNAKALVEKLSEMKNEPIAHITHILSECTLRLIYESSLGVRDDETKEEEKTVKRTQLITEFFIHRMFSPWLYFDFALRIFPYARKAMTFGDRNNRIFSQILGCIKESVRARAQSPVKIEEEEFDVLERKPKSFGEIIIENHMKLPTFPMQQLANEISVLIGAGFDTSAHTLMWSFFSLGLNQDMQQRLYEEISTVTDENVVYKDVQDLVYLDCVVKETLRLYTIIPLFGRRFNKDVQIGKNFIPKDTEVIVFPFALHRNSSIYPDPDKFNPDRFLDADSKITNYNYIPFAEGNRPCVGKNFALLSIKIIMVHVLRKFKIISLDRPEDLLLKWSIVLTCEKEPCMKFIPRPELSG